MSGYVLAIDQGTTSSRAIVFNDRQEIAGMGKMEFTQHFPASGWVEHVPEEIWATCLWAMKTALKKAGVTAADIAAIGITNQRETTLVWDKATGKPIYNAIVWQDRRTARTCDRLKAAGKEKLVAKKTGLLLDPYFSATKIGWILDNVKGARRRAEHGELAFGTVDTYLIWRLTGGASHATDASNASRTLLYNIETGDWDDELLALFRVPRAMLPTVKDNADDFGTTEKSVLGAAIPICGAAGDQQAATIGQACFEPGMMKSTYGTGCFALLNTGSDMVRSKNRLLTTVAYRLNGKTTYALEGAIFVAGASVQWLRDKLRLIEDSADTDALAKASDPASEVYLVPAFVGLGAPWWDAEARGAIYGLTRNTGASDLARAALESVAYQTQDLFSAMRKDWKGARDTVLRVDGGMVASDWTMQFLSDILDVPVDRPAILETTALGAAWLAGWKAGVWPDRKGFAKRWSLERQFNPAMDPAVRKHKLAGWRDAVQRTLTK
ncbi:MAG: glycerol kinase GlpK [Devosia nanyangense]|uniref:Glycerol kinase n=1 Tax=Devosia nanyangense TaxID=1228055 RepID=A0A933L3T1_9HYPH|nr:glycerol kinase GlpK [Devosia nanyangense]